MIGVFTTFLSNAAPDDNMSSSSRPISPINSVNSLSPYKNRHTSSLQTIFQQLFSIPLPRILVHTQREFFDRKETRMRIGEPVYGEEGSNNARGFLFISRGALNGGGPVSFIVLRFC